MKLFHLFLSTLLLSMPFSIVSAQIDETTAEGMSRLSCTSIMVGRRASADGSVITSHTCDSGECLTIADKSEVWIFEIFGEGPKQIGGVWAAVRIPT